MKFIKNVIINGLVIFFTNYSAIGQNTELNLAQKKFLMDALDQLLIDYQVYCSLTEGNKITENYIRNFKKLFAEDAQIFDDITPNYDSKNKNPRELNKHIENYTNDIRSFYPNGIIVKINGSNIGTALQRVVRLTNKWQVTLEIDKYLKGDLYEESINDSKISKVKKTFLNNCKLRLIIDFELDNNYVINLKIKSIKKIISNLSYQSKPKDQKGFLGQLLIQPDFGFHFAQFKGKTDFQNLKFFDDVESESTLLYFASLKLTHILKHKITKNGFVKNAISLGVGLSRYKFALELSDFADTLNRIDRDGDDYLRIIDGRDIIQTNSFTSIDVSLSFNKIFSISPKFDFYFNGGIAASIPINSIQEREGKFSYLAYYPQYNLTLRNDEYSALLSNRFIEAKKSLNLSSVLGFINFEFGVRKEILNTGIALMGGVVFRYSNTVLTVPLDIEDNFILSETENIYNSFLSVYHKTNFNVWGFQFGIRKTFEQRKIKPFQFR